VATVDSLTAISMLTQVFAINSEQNVMATLV